MPPPTPAPGPVVRLEARTGWIVAAGALALAHFAWLLAHFAPAIMSPDANGYVVQARLIVEGGQTGFSPAAPVQYVGMHWLETRDGVFHSRYPAGLPLLMAAAWRIGGLPAALLVNPVLASATVLLVFFLARPFAGGPLALLAAAVVAAIPVTNQHALDADAHVAAAFFLVAGVLALRAFVARPAPGRGILAGVLLGIVPAIRYPEAVIGLAVAGWLAWRVRPAWRAWPAVAGAAIPLGVLGAHNAAAYGAFWKTGYALTNEQTGFGLEYFLRHAIPYLQALSAQGPLLFFALGAAGLATLAVHREWRAEGALFAGIVVPLVLLYMAYYFGGGLGGAGGPGGPGGPGGGAAMGGNLRFLVPTFPFFAVAGAWLLAALVRDFGPAGRVAVGVVATLQLLVSGVNSAQTLQRSQATLSAAARARVAAEQHVPAGSIVILDRTLAESLDAVGRWRIVEEGLIGGLGPRRPGMGPRPLGGGAGGPPADADTNRPSPLQLGKNRAQQERYAGLPPTERRARVWADIAAWAGDRPVYWFARSIEGMENALPGGADHATVLEIEAPAMGFGPRPGGPPMGLGGPGFAGRAGREAGGPRGGGFESPQGGPRGGPGFGPPGGLAGEAAAESGKLRLVKIDLGKT